MLQKRIYCTYFDINYFHQGMTLISSLQKYEPDSLIYVLALDDSVKKIITDPHINLLDINDLKASFPELVEMHKKRKKVEFYFSLTPYLIKYIANLYAHQPCFINYADADLFFFNSPIEIFTELVKYDVALIPHGYARKIESKFLKYGTYNVGLVIFNNTPFGQEILEWWRARCEEWCQDIPENGKYADQGYLDQFKKLNGSVFIINHPGANLAPWNIANRKIELVDDQLRVNEQFNLIFYHFHGLKKFASYFFPNHLPYRAPLTKLIKSKIYTPYINNLIKIENSSKIKYSNNSLISTSRSRGIRMLLSNLRYILILLFNFLTFQYIKIDLKHSNKL